MKEAIIQVVDGLAQICVAVFMILGIGFLVVAGCTLFGVESIFGAEDYLQRYCFATTIIVCIGVVSILVEQVLRWDDADLDSKIRLAICNSDGDIMSDVEELSPDAARLHVGIVDFIHKNRHLADGEDCILSDLKRLVGWRDSPQD